MDRKKAIDVIKEIFSKCNHIEGRSIKLMPPEANNVLSTGCQIHVQANNDALFISCLKAIGKKNNLSIHRERESIIIYKP